MVEDVMARLKEETRSLHGRVEARVDLASRCATREGYRELLGRMLGLYVPLEARLGLLDWASAGIEFEERRKSRLIRADLEALGGATELERAAMAEVPVIDGLSSGFGCLYVLEGSTLGGQIIARHASAALGIGPSSGASFFASYGPRLGEMWKSFGRAARAFCSTEERVREAVRAAVMSFELFEAWLGERKNTRFVQPPLT